MLEDEAKTQPQPRGLLSKYLQSFLCFLIPFTLTKFPLPEAQKHLHGIIVPPLCFKWGSCSLALMPLPQPILHQVPLDPRGLRFSSCRRLWSISACWNCPSQVVLLWFCNGPTLMDRVSDSRLGAVESSWSPAGAEERPCSAGQSVDRSLLPTLLENICFKAWTW